MTYERLEHCLWQLRGFTHQHFTDHPAYSVAAIYIEPFLSFIFSIT